MKRHTTKEERALFHAVATGAIPVVIAKSAPPSRKARKDDGGGGLDGNTLRRLERGELDPDAKLDLHGMTEAGAHRTLAAFVHTAQRRGCRLLLVVTGKGALKPEAPFDLEYGGRSRGVLKTMVPRWLDEPALKRLVAHKGTAHRRHGGDGALYVYLRKA